MFNRERSTTVILLLIATLFSYGESQTGVANVFCRDSPSLGYHCEMYFGLYENRNDVFEMAVFHISGYNDLNVTRLFTSSDFRPHLRYIPSSLLLRFPALTYLDLSYSDVEFLDGVQNCQQLESITLNHNSIVMLGPRIFEFCSNLREISIDSSSIYQVSVLAFVSLPQLQTIKLSNNSITTIFAGTFDSLSELRSVDLSSNGIMTVPSNLFSDLLNLESINLEGNEIERINTASFSHCSVRQISIAYNQITTIDENAFYALEHLQSLYLSNNSISVLRSNSFSSLLRLTSLRLDNNQITAVERNFFDNLPNLQLLQASNNLCVDSNFPSEDDLLNAMETCFQNFDDIIGTTPPATTIPDITTPEITTPGITTPGITTPGDDETTTEAGSSITSKLALIIAFVILVQFAN